MKIYMPLSLNVHGVTNSSTLSWLFLSIHVYFEILSDITDTQPNYNIKTSNFIMDIKDSQDTYETMKSVCHPRFSEDSMRLTALDPNRLGNVLLLKCRLTRCSALNICPNNCSCADAFGKVSTLVEAIMNLRCVILR